MSHEGATGPLTKLLRVWQLAVLRFAVTREDGDRLHVLALAGEVDRSGATTEGSFCFFRRTTAELCHAICGHDEHAEAIVRGFQAQIDDPRLRRAFEAAVAMGGTKPVIVASRTEPSEDIWKGLPPRRVVRT
jgi:hypothetical protein